MVTIDASATRREGVTFVSVVATNDGTTSRRVRLTSALDGPIWPPRRRGVPERGWTDEGVAFDLDPGERRGLGFASPAPAVDPPVRVDDEPAGDADADARGRPPRARRSDPGGGRAPATRRATTGGDGRL